MSMKLAVDAYYAGNMAKVVGVLFENFSDEKPLKIISKIVDDAAPYESGSFYKRELPCIVSLLQDLDVRDISLIVIDGFVYLERGRIRSGRTFIRALGAQSADCWRSQIAF